MQEFDSRKKGLPVAFKDRNSNPQSHSFMQEFAIIVFARHPTPGRVKTRLAAGVGPDAAAIFYKECAELVIQECLKSVNHPLASNQIISMNRSYL